MMPGVPERRTHSYVRHGTTTLFSALDVASGFVIGKCYKRHRAVEFLKFLKEIDAQVPEGLDVHIVMDNYATHKTPKIKSWLARRPHYHVHFTPTSASWINQVERWFAELTRKRIQRVVHTSVRQLEADIRSLFGGYSSVFGAITDAEDKFNGLENVVPDSAKAQIFDPATWAQGKLRAGQAEC